MNIVPVKRREIGPAHVETVNARDLHAALHVGRDFSDWIKRRIQNYGFEEGTDFTVFDSTITGNQRKRGGDRKTVEYFLTIDMAKELAMLENNDAGKRVRRYFIEMERAAREHILSEKMQQAIALYLSPEMRPWAKTFPDELWAEFGRLTGHELEGSKRPQYWGKLVNEFVYGFLSEDVLAWLKTNAPQSRHGQRYHQHFNAQSGMGKLNSHIWLLIGVARQAGSIDDLRNRMKLQSGRPAQLSFFVPPASNGARQ